MGRYDDIQIGITDHALKQYGERVEMMERAELRRLIEQQIRERDISYDGKGWFQLAGVWWVYERHDDSMVFITCYGKSTIDMPKAIGWAARNHDRINLSDGIL